MVNETFTGDKFTYRQQARSSYDLFASIDGYLSTLVKPDQFQALRKEIVNPTGHVLDVGASRAVSRGIALTDAVNTICVDPAYKELGSTQVGEYQAMVAQLRETFDEVTIPKVIDANNITQIDGFRRGHHKSIQLVPQTIEEWLALPIKIRYQTLILWRSFPDDNIWGELLARLPVNGILITTGYGVLNSPFDATLSRAGHIKTGFVGSGVDIDNSPLPQNGNSEALGLQPLTSIENFYFYRKKMHLPGQRLSQILVDNRIK